MRSLYREYPFAPPGLGLLLLRVVLAASLLLDAAAVQAVGLSVLGSTAPPAAGLAGATLLAVLLILGLLTPIATSLAVLLDIGALVIRDPAFLPAADGSWQTPLFRMAVACALVCTGPGAYSIDKRLFGPMEIVIVPRTTVRRREPPPRK